MTEQSKANETQLSPDQIPQQAFDWYDEYAHHPNTF